MVFSQKVDFELIKYLVNFGYTTMTQVKCRFFGGGGAGNITTALERYHRLKRISSPLHSTKTK
ncbi:MAG: hypothetical protein CES88_04385 [Halobacteriovorax sp. JY17]|nr:MAG: hypothetical protein CES88_04385 [Halobacteriovorax sp. JY17]